MNSTSNNSKAGFTLIEVIAVLVILAVLAAVAIPRYVSLINDARDMALEGAVAAGLSHVSLAYGRLALQTGQEPAIAAVRTEAADTNPMRGADFDFTFETAGDTIEVTATERRPTDPRRLMRPWQMP